MSQTSSVAREASMDEILASIRKIIEESDAAASAAEAEGGPRGLYQSAAGRGRIGSDRSRCDLSDDLTGLPEDFRTTTLSTMRSSRREKRN